MALLYEEFAEAKPEIVNDYSLYFAPITHVRTVISLLEKGTVQIKMPRADATSFWMIGPGEVLSTLGGLGGTIPSILSKATWTIRFRFLKEDRLVENRKSHFLFWGLGYQHAISWGTVKYPLFRIYLDASNNHLVLVFDGWITGVNQQTVDTYPFHSWAVDLGPIDDYYDFQNLTVWVDVEQRAFAKVVFGKKDIPFPPGYSLIKPINYVNDILKGLLAGDLLSDPCTNVTMEIQDMQIWAEYFIPKKPSAFPWFLIPLGVVDLAVVGRSFIGDKRR